MILNTVISEIFQFLRDFHVYQFINGYIRECLFHMKLFLGLTFFSALVDSFLYHLLPLATRDREMHQLVLRKSQTLELPHVEKIHTLNLCRAGVSVGAVGANAPTVFEKIPYEPIDF